MAIKKKTSTKKSTTKTPKRTIKTPRASAPRIGKKPTAKRGSTKKSAAKK